MRVYASRIAQRAVNSDSGSCTTGGNARTSDIELLHKPQRERLFRPEPALGARQMQPIRVLRLMQRAGAAVRAFGDDCAQDIGWGAGVHRFHSDLIHTRFAARGQTEMAASPLMCSAPSTTETVILLIPSPNSIRDVGATACVFSSLNKSHTVIFISVPPPLLAASTDPQSRPTYSAASAHGQ